ncbi:MAG: hypothetical protein WDN49_15505, partial [Acetobacteraceae bacterium]
MPPDQAEFVFTGDLVQAIDPSTNEPIDLITLCGPCTSPAEGVVIVNLMFQNASISFKGATVTQDPNSVWSLSYAVSLIKVRTTQSALPTQIANQMQTNLRDVPASQVQIWQLGFDWANAHQLTLSGFDYNQEDLLMALPWLEKVLPAYLAQTTSSMGIGYFAICDTFFGPPATMPTAFDFCITAYNSATDPGLSSSPLDTLNYLFMVQNHKLPSTPPEYFSFNWVDDVDIDGAAAISAALVFTELADGANPILPIISPVLTADANTMTITLGSGVAASFPPFASASTGYLTTVYDYHPKEVTNAKGGVSQKIVSGTYSSNCSAVIGCDNQNAADSTKITLSGASTFSARFEYASDSPPVEGTTIPSSTYNWYVVLEVQADLTNPGQLNMAITDSNFDTDPVVTGESNTTWDQVLSGLSGSSLEYATGVTQLGTDVQTSVVNEILPTLLASLLAAGSLIFPGGQTFLFATPQFTRKADLVADLSFYD